MAARTRRPKLAVWKFSSCDGCQLSLLDCEDDLLDLAAKFDFAYFPEASSAIDRGPYDVSLVEGSISTPEEAERIHRVRRRSRTLVAIGACATSGGIQALRNFGDADAWTRAVYGRPDAARILPRSTPLSDHVEVDLALRGCPVPKEHVVETLSAWVHGRRPALPEGTVCAECKRAGVACVLVAGGEPCLGPVTHAGCGALCPSHRRGCYGCFGPAESADPAALGDRFRQSLGRSGEEVARRFRGIHGWAEPFRRESERHGR